MGIDAYLHNLETGGPLAFHASRTFWLMGSNITQHSEFTVFACVTRSFDFIFLHVVARPVSDSVISRIEFSVAVLAT
jgi:hypothetical protein